ncbi:DUF134 domain-containing protein [Halanaerobium sp. Z-7514]|uniref:UPF0251 protein LJ207_03010 n=1 Tax=Halanaerobium polyolivorans TaxID=2886943 RepID=A0AAW4WYR1_9FIRM|nr:DUF134 domain-containing protein [Halanaerobium polyolivorans]MCC3144289.1 DUF134 domain-containing protein [Halanaerobium polyolivorans]RQD69718.1 MAG: DUF134 domain-containing protein [Halanaerobium sp. MSAO_Bac5]
MARPTKDRIIEQLPEIKFFKPAGVPAKKLETVEMTMEEVEALRLKDVKGLTQAEAAEIMKVSRPTFQRVLTSARQKAADALTCGKAIRFEGGDYRVVRPGHCPKCGEKHQGRKKHHHGHENKKKNSKDKKKNK